MADSRRDARVFSADQVVEIAGDSADEDQSGAAERVAEIDREHPLESPQAIRRPPDESGEDQR